MSDSALWGACCGCLILGIAAGWAWSRSRSAVLVRHKQQALDEALRQARTDLLTGLANRRAFDEHLKRYLAISRRYQHPLAVVLLDVDDLKAANDQHGHVAGDSLLQRFARLLTDTIRISDLPARIGGDEFAVLLPQTDLVGAVVLTRRLLPDDRPRAEVPSACAGIAQWMADESAEQLLTRADQALYHAKRAGRGRISVHDGKQAVSQAASEPL